MTLADVMIQYGWLIALLLTVSVISWSVLLLQALFYDKRIALVGVFASLLVAFIAVFPELVPVAGLTKLFAVVLCLGFMLWFFIKQYHKPYVFMPVGLLMICTLVAVFLWQKITW